MGLPNGNDFMILSHKIFHVVVVKLSWSFERVFNWRFLWGYEIEFFMWLSVGSFFGAISWDSYGVISLKYSETINRNITDVIISWYLFVLSVENFSWVYIDSKLEFHRGAIGWSILFGNQVEFYRNYYFKFIWGYYLELSNLDYYPLEFEGGISNFWCGY